MLHSSATRTTDAQLQWSLFSLKSRTFGLGQTNWTDKFWGIWGIFGRTISTNFRTVTPLSMFSTIQPLFLQAFISTSQIFIWNWDLNLGFSLRVFVVRVPYFECPFWNSNPVWTLRMLSLCVFLWKGRVLALLMTFRTFYRSISKANGFAL